MFCIKEVYFFGQQVFTGLNSKSSAEVLPGNGPTLNIDLRVISLFEV